MSDDDQPTMACPSCGKVFDDYDGISVIYCAPDGCGYCRHVSRSASRGVVGWVCDYCGDVKEGGDVDE